MNFKLVYNVFLLFINNFCNIIFLTVAEGPYIDVVKLQTMRCLFEAYEHVLSLLENVFTPMFCHSDEVSQNINLISKFINDFAIIR